ncbi:hypothetical protein [Rhizobium ruizarguesonis]|uniref:hypothetical protein n=1 Tax=Rhizobium ruizarguesonis TaxID=2081791 RepID=UPI0010304AAF|nr:hypothetical protein [Rhizobium ruizarguesonis]TAW02083.1 hypothetical protein ELI25_37615 [Rhizobium ruizarguesonis]TAZ47020.1 hypothetical protein ELH76_32475 [Rhizobium ruizarguesonis]
MTFDPMQSLNYLAVAAKSPLAFTAYLAVIVAWIARFWFSVIPRSRAEQIARTFSDDQKRTTALSLLLGEAPPAGLPRNEILQWVQVKSKEKSWGYIFATYLCTLFALVVVLGLSAYTYLEHSADPIDGQPITKLDEKVDRAP